MLTQKQHLCTHQPFWLHFFILSLGVCILAQSSPFVLAMHWSLILFFHYLCSSFLSSRTLQASQQNSSLLRRDGHSSISGDMAAAGLPWWQQLWNAIPGAQAVDRSLVSTGRRGSEPQWCKHSPCSLGVSFCWVILSHAGRGGQHSWDIHSWSHPVLQLGLFLTAQKILFISKASCLLILAGSEDTSLLTASPQSVAGAPAPAHSSFFKPEYVLDQGQDLMATSLIQNKV